MDRFRQRTKGEDMEPYQQLEKEFGEWAKVQNVVCCSSGTAALHLALESLRLPPGSKVIVPDFTMIACPRAVVMAGLVPVFVDCKEDLTMDPERLDEALKDCDDFPAVMIVHIYGRRCDMDELLNRICFVDIKTIEDMAEAHGVPVHHTTDAACWSYYRNKIIAGEEGGAVAFKSLDDAITASSLRSLGFTVDHDFYHLPRGHNYRLSNCHAKLILGSLRLAASNGSRNSIDVRRDIEMQYNVHCPVEWRMPPRDVPWVYDLRIPGMTSERQGEVVRELNRAGIAARHAFKPMSWQTEFEFCKRYGGQVAAKASREVLYLPIQPGVTTEEQVERSFEILKSRVQ